MPQNPPKTQTLRTGQLYFSNCQTPPPPLSPALAQDCMEWGQVLSRSWQRPLPSYSALRPSTLWPRATPPFWGRTGVLALERLACAHGQSQLWGQGEKKALVPGEGLICWLPQLGSTLLGICLLTCTAPGTPDDGIVFQWMK